jgi:putative endonuclease
MYYVYLLRCKDNSLYCGITNNIKKRVAEHNFSKTKGAKYTLGRRPVTCIYFEKYETKSHALKREFAIKTLTKKQKEILVKTIAKKT